MTPALILWSHALAAFGFGWAASVAWATPGRDRARTVFAVALALSALWALAVAGIDARDLSTRLVEAARNLAWLAFALILVRRARSGGWALLAVFAAVAGVVLIGAALAAGEAITRSAPVVAELADARLVFRMMAAAGALVIVRHLHRAAEGAVKLIATALALMWGAELVTSAYAYLLGSWPAVLGAARGCASAGVAALLAVAAQRRDRWTLALSRPAALRTMAAAALVLYVGAVAALMGVAAQWGGAQARALQAALVIGATAALLALLSTSWLGPWAKVKLAKHLFQHRYDYRTEWQRFTARLGGGGAPLGERVAQAIAELLDAPAALLIGVDAAQAAWRCDGAPDPLPTNLAEHLTATRRIIELDAVRAGTAAERDLVPAWMIARADSWALVPLLHGDALAGAVLLARPPIDRALDWEDFDLLRVAGQQAASHLAEDRAGRALAEAQRFDEFHRRFAFILHDIKNLVSQQQLVARNAERHADNPAFRADMIATLKESADRMTTLLARLSQAEPMAAGPATALDAAALLRRIAGSRRAQHPVAAIADAPCWIVAHPQRLEQVVNHLVQNAIEASGSDTSVTLSAVSEAGRACIEIADHGAGMTPAFIRDELFRPFASTKPGGFGIGAFEARQLVMAMGGELHVDSRPGEGTRFRILLSAAPALEEAA